MLEGSSVDGGVEATDVADAADFADAPEAADDVVAADAAKQAFIKAVLQLVPPESFDVALQEASEEVDKAVKQAFGEEASTLVYGSLVQSVHLTGSDLDLCVDVPGLPDAAAAAAQGGKQDNTGQVNALKLLLKKMPPKTFQVTETRFFTHIKVPIAMLAFKSSNGTEVMTDISAGKVYDGVEKDCTDRLIRKVLAESPKVTHSVRLIKLWAKAENINKAYDGYLNSLGWALLVVYFYLERGDVSSVSIQTDDPSDETLEGGALPSRLHPQEPDDMFAELEVPGPNDIAEFFEWLLKTSADWPTEGNWALSLVDTNLIEVPPPAKTWADSSSFYIEDPGPRVVKGVSDNVARSLKTVQWQETLSRCTEAAKTLRSQRAGDHVSWVKSLLSKKSQKAQKALPGKGGARLPVKLAPRIGWGQPGARPTLTTPAVKAPLKPGVRAPVKPGMRAPLRPGVAAPYKAGARPALVQAPLRPGVRAPLRPVQPSHPPPMTPKPPSIPPPGARPGGVRTPVPPRHPPGAAAGVQVRAPKAPGMVLRPPMKRPLQPSSSTARGPPSKLQRSSEMCKWFLQGECWSGETCPRSHG